MINTTTKEWPCLVKTTFIALHWGFGDLTRKVLSDRTEIVQAVNCNLPAFFCWLAVLWTVKTERLIKWWTSWQESMGQFLMLLGITRLVLSSSISMHCSRSFNVIKHFVSNFAHTERLWSSQTVTSRGTLWLHRFWWAWCSQSDCFYMHIHTHMHTRTHTHTHTLTHICTRVHTYMCIKQKSHRKCEQFCALWLHWVFGSEMTLFSCWKLFEWWSWYTTHAVPTPKCQCFAILMILTFVIICLWCCDASLLFVNLCVTLMHAWTDTKINIPCTCLSLGNKWILMSYVSRQQKS